MARGHAQRKETIERVFADAEEKHTMRYTHHRGLAAVTRCVRLKYVAMNLKNWQIGVGITPLSLKYYPFFAPDMSKPQSSLNENWGFWQTDTKPVDPQQVSCFLFWPAQQPLLSY